MSKSKERLVEIEKLAWDLLLQNLSDAITGKDDELPIHAAWLLDYFTAHGVPISDVDEDARYVPIEKTIIGALAPRIQQEQMMHRP